MTQTTSNQTKVGDEVDQLTQLESVIAELFPGEVFDFPYILTPESSFDIRLTAPLSAKQIDALTNYNSFAQNFFSSLGLEIELVDNLSVFEKFLELSRSIYLYRFVEARKLCAKYSLFAIPTLGAIQIALNSKEDTENTLSMEIDIQDGLVVNFDGTFNFDETVKREKETDTIKSIFSSISNFLALANKSIVDLSNITTRSFLISMNENILIDIMQVALQNIIIEVDKLVYDYINRGYTPRDAFENVRELLVSSTSKKGTKLPESLGHIQKDTESLVLESINKYIKVEEKIIEELFTDIMELIVHYSSQGELVSKNFYKLKFIHHAELPAEYRNYHHVVELYLMDDSGDTLSTPSEAYDIDFSRQSKEAIFRLVTNGFNNPRLPITSYLYRV